MSAGSETPDKIVRTVCSPNCSGTCGINAHVKDERIIKIEPGEFPDPRFERICLKGIAMAMQRIHAPNRLTQPLRRTGPRGSGQWEALSWEQTFDYLAGELSRIGERHGKQANAWTTMTGNYGVTATTAPNRIASCLEGTWFTYLGLMGDAGCSMGYLPSMGVFNTANEWADLKGAKLILLFARNLADTGHSEMHFLFDAMDAGAKLVVIDPRFSRTASKADIWLSPRPGTDTALLIAMINVIVAEQLFDRQYAQRHTNLPFLVREDSGELLRAREVFGDGDDFVVWDGQRVAGAEAVASPALHYRGAMTLRDGAEVRVCTAFDAMWREWQVMTPAHAESICDIPAASIRDLARAYAKNAPAALWLGQGMQRYYHGHLAFRAAITLGALCGNIGRRHAGVNWSDGAMFRLYFSLPEHWLTPGGRRAREMPGTRMLDHIARADPYPIKSLWLAGYGFGTQSPNFDKFVREALPALDLFVVTEQVMTPAAEYADLVLPCVSYYEDDFDLVPSAENLYLQLRRRAIAPVGESKNDWDIFKGVAERMGAGEHWQMDGEAICQHLLRGASDPAVNSVDWDVLKRDGVVRLELPQPHVPFADQQFPTASGRVELYLEQFHPFGHQVLRYEPPLEGRDAERHRHYPLTLITNHPVHTVHSQHTNLPWIREQVAEPLLEMHPLDAAPRAVASGDFVRVFNERGAFVVRALITQAARPGTLNLPQGWWPRHFKQGHYNDVVQLTMNPAQDAIVETNFAIFDNSVEVEKTGADPQARP